MKIMRLDDFLIDYNASPEEVKNLKFINIRGCNGSGKSTIVNEMMKYDDPFEVVDTFNGKSTVMFTVFPQFKFISLGKYVSTRKCGGCDTFSSFTPQYEDMGDFYSKFLDKIWNIKYNIIMEGVIISTVLGTYLEIFQKLKGKNTRDVITYIITTPLDVCISRVKSRNGGVDINEKYIESKFRTVQKAVRIFRENGLHVIECDNSKYPMNEALPNFLKDISSPLPDYKNFVKEDNEW